VNASDYQSARRPDRREESETEVKVSEAVGLQPSETSQGQAQLDRAVWSGSSISAGFSGQPIARIANIARDSAAGYRWLRELSKDIGAEGNSARGRRVPGRRRAPRSQRRAVLLAPKPLGAAGLGALSAGCAWIAWPDKKTPRDGAGRRDGHRVTWFPVSAPGCSADAEMRSRGRVVLPR
jgi:hypothetical protein